MIAQVTGKRQNKIMIDLDIVDHLMMIRSYERLLANPDKYVSVHISAANAVVQLRADLYKQLSESGFADPVFFAECLGYETDVALDARNKVSNKIKEHRNSTAAYYTSKALRFDENYQPPLTWPVPNLSRDAD